MYKECHTSGCDACDLAWFDLASRTWVCPYALLQIPILETESVPDKDEV